MQNIMKFLKWLLNMNNIKAIEEETIPSDLSERMMNLEQMLDEQINEIRKSSSGVFLETSEKEYKKTNVG